MSYQLPPPIDDVIFEQLVRDIMRRVYDDPGIERFGRKGQKQFGIDGLSPADSSITFQCKLKDSRHESDHRIRDRLLGEMEEELRKTNGLPRAITRFIFASTFKNDTELQNKAALLSSTTLTVEYWGWETITDRIWEYAEQLIPIYYPQILVRPVHGFKQISNALMQESRITDPDQLKQLALKYYRINDRANILLPVVINEIDVRNTRVMEEIFKRLERMSPSATLWLIGDGGSGKTTILHRVAVELARRGENVFTLDLGVHIDTRDVETILTRIKFCSPSEQTVLCIDNPAADELTLERLFREIPDYAENVHVILAERGHRYSALRRSGVLTYLHDEEETGPLKIWNPRLQREQVYQRLFDLLAIDEADRQALLATVRDERLVYVNATYQILLELKKRRKIVFDFDWDDYRKAAADLPAFREGYKYIALFYLFGVRTPFNTFSRICGASESEQTLFLDRFRGLVNEPIVVDEWRDESFHKITHLRTKHEIVSDIFFTEYPEINKDEMLMAWCERIDFADPVEVQALINIFGAKKNYSGENQHINFEYILKFLLEGYIAERVKVSPKLYATLHSARSWLLLAENRVEESIEVLLMLLKQQPTDLHSRTELAKIYQRQGKLSEAEALLLTIPSFKPNDLDSRTELAKIYQRQGKLVEAEAILRELLQLDNKNIRGRTELAKVYQRQNRLREAEEVLNPIFDIAPKDINFRTELAKIYQRRGELAKAEKLLLEILQRKPSDLNSRTELAKIYQRQGKLAEAETHLAQLLRLDPNNLQARTELAKIYQRQGKLADAETLLLELLKLEPEDLQARTELAKIYQRQGKLAEAETLLLQSLEIDDRQLHPRTELAKIYQRQGKLNEAVAIAEEVLAIDSLNNFAMSELLGAWTRQGEKEKCAKRFLAFIEQPQYEFSRYSQAPVFRFFQCCRKFGLKKEAKLVYEQFQSQLDDRNVDFYKSTLLLRR